MIISQQFQTKDIRIQNSCYSSICQCPLHVVQFDFVRAQFVFALVQVFLNWYIVQVSNADITVHNNMVLSFKLNNVKIFEIV